MCREVGMALVSTSANVSGAKAIRTARECQRQFGNQGSGGSGPGGQAAQTLSTIQDIVTGKCYTLG